MNQRWEKDQRSLYFFPNNNNRAVCLSGCLFKNILEKNNENILPTYTFLDYSTRMKIRNKEDREVFERVEYLFLNSRESKIDILESLMDLYEQIKGKYYEE